MTMAAAGARNIDIARKLNMTPERVSNWRQEPEFRAGVREIVREVEESTRARLESLTVDAIDVLEYYVGQGKNRKASSRDALLAAVKVLDRVLDNRGEAPERSFDPDESYL